jgi:curved DNA-binding protein
MKYKDYYAMLGVPRDAKAEDIKRAYRRLARKYHPDVSKERNAEERIKEINEAYEVLKDAQKRHAYDQLGADWQAGQDFTPPPGWEHRAWSFGRGGFSEAQFSDFFDALFGGLGVEADVRASRAHGRRGFDVTGDDEHASIAVTLEEAYHGSHRMIDVRIPAHDEHGRLSTRIRSLRVNIPRGVTAGKQIRLTGQGGRGLGAAPPGDLYLTIQLLPHPVYRAEGRDIHMRLPVAPWEAALGAAVTVPTLGGKVELKVPAGSQTGRRLRLRGRGLPGTPPGDQYVELQIVVPVPQSPAQRELYERMQREMRFNPRADLEAEA